MPSDAMRPEAYDGNDSTGNSLINSYMQVDSSMQGKNIRVLWYNWSIGSLWHVNLNFMNENKEIISSVVIYSNSSTTIDKIYKIPEGTRWIKYSPVDNRCRLYDIKPCE